MLSRRKDENVISETGQTAFWERLQDLHPTFQYIYSANDSRQVTRPHSPRGRITLWQHSYEEYNVYKNAPNVHGPVFSGYFGYQFTKASLN